MDTTDYFYADSRGEMVLRGIGPEDRVRVLAEATLSTIMATVAADFGDGSRSPAVVYIMGGIYDLIRFDDNGETVTDVSKGKVDALLSVMDWLVKNLESVGVHVVFATVPSMSLRTWNKHRLTEGKVDKLTREEDYPAMQETLTQALEDLNKGIQRRAYNHLLHLPALHTVIRHIRGSGQGICWRYNRLHDGLHPNADIAVTFRTLLRKSMVINERTLDETQDLEGTLGEEEEGEVLEEGGCAVSGDQGEAGAVGGEGVDLF